MENKKIAKGYRLRPETHEMITKIKNVLKEDSDKAINTACRKFLEEIKKKGETKMKKIIITLILALSFITANVCSQNCSNTSVGYPPINDLGTGYWRGFQGGLYPFGQNFRPVVHNSAGVQLASQVRPLDVNGNYDPANGKIVWLSIGMSHCTMETGVLIPMVDTIPNRNMKMIMIDGAQASQSIEIIIDSTANFWNVINTRLSIYGLSRNQVQAIWFKEAEANPTDSTFPGYPLSLKAKYKTAMNIIMHKFPNAHLCYVSSRIYGGYASITLNPEPYAYYSGWTVKWLIEDQINGDPDLAYTGSNPKSPWLCWAPYTWADGLTPRSDGLTWVCPNDFESDGTHPTTPGRRKVASRLCGFFTTDATTVPWFLTPVGIQQISTIAEKFSMNQNYPNPFNPETKIEFSVPSGSHNVKITVYDMLGREVQTLVNEKFSQGIYETDFNGTNYSSGIYFYRLESDDFAEIKKMILIK